MARRFTLGDLTGHDGPSADRPVERLAIDHRQADRNTIFGAFPGTAVNGEDYIEGAVENGAIAVVARPAARVPDGVIHLATADPRGMMAAIAARFFAPQPKVLAAVTGTNGKTSVAEMTRQLWAALGHRSASIGTLGLTSEGVTYSLGMTTPDVLTFFEKLGELARDGIDHVAFEASSHGLEQRRTDGARLAVAAFTNLSRDHLDYHPTVDAYFDAKARLFREVLPGDGRGVVWMDNAFSPRVLEILRQRGIAATTVGTGADCDIRLLSQTPRPDGQALSVGCADGAYEVRLPLIGAYQGHNALVAAAMVIATGGRASDVFGALGNLVGVAGRLQHAATTKAGAPVYVDYAHTPAGLETALHALRPHTDKRLHVVFGCGGDRDRGKRPMMGEIATRLADHVIVTDDNPRSEDAAAIREEVMAGAPGAENIGDRRNAIVAAVAAAGAGDVVLVAGKGHEQGQIVGRQVLPFDDVAVAQEACR